MISYRLYKDATQYTGGEHVRDLSKLNRDLSKARGGRPFFVSALARQARSPGSFLRAGALPAPSFRPAVLSLGPAAHALSPLPRSSS